MKAFLRAYDYTGTATCESIKEGLAPRLSYGWKIVSVSPAGAEIYDFVVIAEKTGRADKNRRPL